MKPYIMIGLPACALAALIIRHHHRHRSAHDGAGSDDADHLAPIAEARPRDDEHAIAELAAAHAVPARPGDGNLFRELLVLWPAWAEIVKYVTRDEPHAADPQSVFSSACAAERDRLAARLYGFYVGDTLAEAERILDEVLELAKAGRRPRSGTEMGLTADMFHPRPSTGEAA
jgi:hypothetical protein